MATEEELRRGMEPVPVERADPDAAIAYFGGRFASDPRFQTFINQLIQQLVEQKNDAGEELWRCRSRYIGPLAGHEGLGIVKEGQVLRYKSIMHY